MPKRLDSPLAVPGPVEKKLSRDGISAQDVGRLPQAYLQRMDTWRIADLEAKALIRERSIEELAQRLDGKDEHNMMQIAKRYPNISPGLLQGLAQGIPQAMPDESTAEPFSDQGDMLTVSLNNIYRDDIASNIANKTYGATETNPLPQQSPLGAIVLGGTVNAAPSSATDFSAEGLVPDQGREGEGWFDQMMPKMPSLQDIKDRFNFGMNAAFASTEVSNAATETSAGNE